MKLIFRVWLENWHFMSSFILESSDLNFNGFFKFKCRVIISWLTSVLDGLICFFAKKLALYRTIAPNVNSDSI